ncbi:MAG: manganese efflux pump MntP family protein [Eubacteriales bacterium]
MGFEFFAVSIMFGFGLAMDAFSVSLANGMNEKCMKVGRMCTIAGVFAFFQALMPMLGWVCVHTILSYFEQFSKLIPYIALALLSYIGGKMIYEGVRRDCDCDACAVSFGALILQGVATSIDALSVGLDIAEYNFIEAFVSAFIIAIVTFIICMFGLYIGKKFGNRLSNKASIFGGVILVGIGIYIFIKGILGI